MSSVIAIPGLDAAAYSRHMLHADERLWVEKNCYVDVIIELLHALGLEPLAAMGFCAEVDFEGDNFTFFKPSHDEVRSLYGVDFQELNVWRPLIEHAAHHLASRKLISTEVDSFFLPDTSGTDYRRNHVKTTIIMAELDREARRLGYFHSAGYHVLEGDDFDGVFRTNVPRDAALLPLFAELVRYDRLHRRSRGELATIARQLLSVHVGRRPERNPIDRFAAQFVADLPDVQRRGLDYYHMWAFATTRQLGAASELLALHLRWLAESGEGDGFTSAADEFMRLSEAAKSLILKGARAVNSKKPFETAAFGEMAGAWSSGMTAIERELGAPASAP